MLEQSPKFAVFPAGRGNVRGARMIQPTRLLVAPAASFWFRSSLIAIDRSIERGQQVKGLSA
jgi:hypothetical protein